MVVERLLAISGEDRITIDHKYHPQWTGTLSARDKRGGAAVRER